MINYSKYKKQFVDSGVFTLSGEQYTGYVDILNGVPYVYNETTQQNCSVVTDTVQDLTPLNTYQTDLLTSPYFFDRLVDDQTVLPYTLDDITIQANDFLSEEVINKKISLLKSNNTYCFSRLFIPNNDIPYNTPTYASFTTLSSSEFTVLSSTTSSIAFADSIIPDLAEIRNLACINKVQNETDFIMFAHTDTSLLTLSGTIDSIDLISSSNLYQDNFNENTQTFSKISDICVQNNNLFITDTGNNAILKYDVSTYVVDDPIFKPSRILVDVVGSKGVITDNYKFNAPTLITASSTHVYVFDSGNRTIKVYDTNFDFTTRINAINFKAETLLALEFNKVSNLLYVITQLITGEVKLYVIDNTFNVTNVSALEQVFLPGEIIQNIAFSYNNSNIFYICTNFNVYKKLINRPEKVIGRFSANKLFRIVDIFENNVSNIWNYVSTLYKNCAFKWNLLPPTDGNLVENDFSDSNRCIFITPQTSDYDRFFLITGSKIFFFRETMSYKRVLKTENITNYGKSNLNLFGEEYVQASTLNKELYKLVTDIFLLKNNIRGRFYGAYDNQGILVLQDYNYNVNFDNFVETIPENFFIHENEKGITGVINRVLTQIYNLQVSLIELTAVDRGDSYVPVFNAGSLQSSNVLIID